jgi:hypothetical protein
MGGARSGNTLPSQILPLHGVPICTPSVGLMMDGGEAMGRSKEGRMTRWNVGLLCMEEIQETQDGGNVSKVLK